jgi:hypothetical protein
MSKHLDLYFTPEQRTALSELFSIARLITGMSEHRDPTAERILDIVIDRIRNLIGGDRGSEPWALSDDSLLNVIEEFSSYLKPSR